MAGNTFTQKIKIFLDGAGKATADSKKLSKGMDGLAKSALKAGAAYFGARGIITGIKTSIELFAKQELAEKKLQIALGKTSNALLTQATALQKSTMFGDEAIIEAQALIASFVKEEEAIMAATEATLDLAAAKGMDLVVAADLVSKTLGSSTNALSRYGIQVEGSVGSTERLNSLTGNLAEVFGGQATEQTNTLAGSIEQMNNSLGDMAEKIGQMVAPIVIDMTGWFSSAADSVQEFFQEVTETDMEKTIRQMKELGINTSEYEKQLLKLQLSQKEQQIIQRDVTDDMDAIEKAQTATIEGRTFALEELFKLQSAGVKEYKKGLMETGEEAEANMTKDQKRMSGLNELLGMTESYNVIIEENMRILGEREVIMAKLTALDEKEIETILPKKTEETNKYTKALQEGLKVLTQTEEITKKNVTAAMAIGASTTSAADAASGAATVFITAKIQEAIATMIAKAFGELGFFGGLGVAMGASVLGKNLATTIKSIQAAEGFDGIVTEPTLILAGEEGAEYVDIEPTMNEGQGRGGASIVFTGNVLSKDFIEDEAVPMIRAALRKGGDIGIS